MPKPTLTLKNPFSPRKDHAEVEIRSAERDAEEEIARNLWKHHRILTPASPTGWFLARALNRWEWLLVVLVSFTSWQIPFVLSFNLPTGPRIAMKIFDYVIDFFFWVDIFLGFSTSFYVDGQLTDSRKAIVKHQFTSWIFYADVAATFPWDDLGGTLRALRLLRLLR